MKTQRNKISKEFLLNEYINNKLSTYKIAVKLKCSKTTISKWLKIYNIKTRTKKEAFNLWNQYGENNPNWQNGRKTKKHFCIDCKINEICYENWRIGGGRCISCASKEKISTFLGFWLGKSNKYIIVNHHIDLKENSDRIMQMPQGQHRSLHQKGYHYLVYLGLEKEYIKNFLEKHQDAIVAQNVQHHIDCDRGNNNKDNFLYLASMAIHMRLHQEAYEYLVKKSMVDKYIEWFFLMEKKATEMVNI